MRIRPEARALDGTPARGSNYTSSRDFSISGMKVLPDLDETRVLGLAQRVHELSVWTLEIAFDHVVFEVVDGSRLVRGSPSSPPLRGASTTCTATPFLAIALPDNPAERPRAVEIAGDSPMASFILSSLLPAADCLLHVTVDMAAPGALLLTTDSRRGSQKSSNRQHLFLLFLFAPWGPPRHGRDRSAAPAPAPWPAWPRPWAPRPRRVRPRRARLWRVRRRPLLAWRQQQRRPS